MFENSILNKLDIYCQFHPKNKVCTICTDPQCIKAPLLCLLCLEEFDYKGQHVYHQKQLRNLWDGLIDLSALIERDRSSMDSLYKIVVANKQNEQLIRWQQERQRHSRSFQNHINSLKYQIEESVKVMLRTFELAVEQSKAQVFKELDSYYKTYKDNFQIFSRLLDPLLTYNHSHKYFSNFNHLAMKLYTQPKKKASDWVLDLKKTLSFTSKVTSNPNTFEQLLVRATKYMNAMIDSLPLYQTDEQKAGKLIRQTIYQIIKGGMVICDLKSLNLILSTVDPSVDDRRGKKIFQQKNFNRKNSAR